MTTVKIQLPPVCNEVDCGVITIGTCEVEELGSWNNTFNDDRKYPYPFAADKWVDLRTGFIEGRGVITRYIYPEGQPREGMAYIRKMISPQRIIQKVKVHYQQEGVNNVNLFAVPFLGVENVVGGAIYQDGDFRGQTSSTESEGVAELTWYSTAFPPEPLGISKPADFLDIHTAPLAAGQSVTFTRVEICYDTLNICGASLDFTQSSHGFITKGITGYSDRLTNPRGKYEAGLGWTYDRMPKDDGYRGYMGIYTNIDSNGQDVTIQVSIDNVDIPPYGNYYNLRVVGIDTNGAQVTVVATPWNEGTGYRNYQYAFGQELIGVYVLFDECFVENHSVPAPFHLNQLNIICS